MLDRLVRFGKKNKLIEEMHGEIYALEYALGKRDDLF
jgi:hypothetical protein